MIKPELVSKDAMLYVWWDCKKIAQYGLLPRGKTIDSDLYCQQLAGLQQDIEKDRKNWIGNFNGSVV